MSENIVLTTSTDPCQIKVKQINACRFQHVRASCFNFDTTPIIWLLIKIISDIATNYNYLSDFNEILYSSQLKDGEYNGENYFSKMKKIFKNYATPLIRQTIRTINIIRGQL